MKVVHIVTYDSYGAGRAAYRISESLNKVGVDSSVFVIEKKTNNNISLAYSSFVDTMSIQINNKLNRIRERNIVKCGDFQTELFGIPFSDFSELCNSDVIHLHWLNNGFWSKKFINKIQSLGKPIIWTMHDMWPFTGGCHYNLGCEGYLKGCRNCRLLRRPSKRDESYRQTIRKCSFYVNSNITFVGCSNWITNEFKSSYIGKTTGKQCFTIPNPINQSIFRKLNKERCREFLNIPLDKKIILFGAVSANDDIRKGYKYLKESIAQLDNSEYEAVLFGNTTDVFFNIQTYNMGIISDDLHLALLYNAADCFVAPSIQENLANTVLEALSCGTPVVAFDIGGMSDMIIHEKNGYLAKPFVLSDLLKGIRYCTDNNDKLNTDTIRHIIESFSEYKIGNDYNKLYNSILR